MISSLKFTKKGILNEFPFVRKFDEKLFNSVSERLGLDLDSVDSANVADAGRNAHLANDGSRRDATFDEDEPRSLNSNMVGIEAMNLDANGNSTAEIQLCSVEARYEMDDYDDDDQDMDEVAIEKEIDAEEMEELRIEPNDSIIVASKFEDDVSQLEIYVYEQDNLYVHHDILLSQMALATEVIDYNGQYCAVGTFNPIIEVFNLNEYQPMLPEIVLGDNTKAAQVKPNSHTDAVLTLSWNSLQPNLLLSGSADTSIKLWDLNNQKAVYSYTHHTSKVSKVSWHPSQLTIMASGGYDKLVCANDSRAPLELKKFRISSDVESLSWSPFNENLLYCSGEDGMVSVFDLRSDKLLYNLQAHDGASCMICLSPFFENLMLTASSDSTCKLWDLNNGQPKLLTTRKMNGDKLFDCMFDLFTRFSPDENGICCLGGSSGDLIVWDIGNLASVAGVFGIKPKHKELVVLEDQKNEE